MWKHIYIYIKNYSYTIANVAVWLATLNTNNRDRPFNRVILLAFKFQMCNLFCSKPFSLQWQFVVIRSSFKFVLRSVMLMVEHFRRVFFSYSYDRGLLDKVLCAERTNTCNGSWIVHAIFTKKYVLRLLGSF